ncbi:pentapeptide repeat-containing protein [Hasllibacter sp. MH4015]|uniref:pentapeptide repeat-containing protein n=1 Tax=Hasllibacter sp. MH4015 TaxID=2854029 RepID=UPI001CD68E15|nr:pentapeptide repeat-containing protein [Hasllibacter sp. MH4015]
MTGAELLADLQRPWRHGEHVDARGIVLEDALVLDGLEVRGFDLSGATLKGGLSARGTTFRGLAWLRGTTIRGMCDMSGGFFRTDLRADGLVAEDVVLDGVHVQGVLSLTEARLTSLSLKAALMMANTTLQGSHITGNVDLTGAEIMGGLWSATAQIGAMRTRDAEISGRLRLPG